MNETECPHFTALQPITCCSAVYAVRGVTMDDKTMGLFTMWVDSNMMMMIRCLYLMYENGKLMQYDSFKEFAEDVSDYMHVITNMSKDERFELTNAMVTGVRGK